MVLIDKGFKAMTAAAVIRTLPRGERPTNRSSLGLRNALFDEIDALRRGDGDAQRAHAVAQLAKAILETARLEMRFKESKMKITPLQLGDNDDKA